MLVCNPANVACYCIRCMCDMLPTCRQGFRQDLGNWVCKIKNWVCKIYIFYFFTFFPGRVYSKLAMYNRASTASCLNSCSQSDFTVVFEIRPRIIISFFLSLSSGCSSTECILRCEGRRLVRPNCKQSWTCRVWRCTWWRQVSCPIVMMWSSQMSRNSPVLMI